VSRFIAVLAALLCAACGTNVKEMIRAESRRLPYAERVMAAAEPLDSGLEQPLLDAETAKFEACAKIYEATRTRMFHSDQLTFFDFMLSDAKQIGAMIYPVSSVERCRRAHQAYNAALDVLDRELRRRGVIVPEDTADYTPGAE
jgi:hypothetical protein